MKPIAIQLYTVRDLCAQDFKGTIKRIADIGYRGIEIGGTGGMTTKELRAFTDDLGIAICCGHGGLPTPETVDQIVDDCNVLGAKFVVSGVGPGDVNTMDGVKATAGKFQTSAELLKPSGLKFVFHNHWWEFLKVDGKVPYEIILDLAPDAFSELDVYWCAFGGDDPAKVLKEHGKRVPLLHVKDGPLTGDPPDPHTAVGKGKVDMPAVFSAADPNVAEWAIVELDFCKTDMMQAVVDSYTYLTSNGLAAGSK